MNRNSEFLEEAYRRADARSKGLLQDATMLTVEKAAQRLGVSPETINMRAKKGTLLALDFGERGKRFPQWQFEDRVAGAGMEAVLAALAGVDQWERYRFFLQVQPILGGRTPVEALRDNEDSAVRHAAAVWAKGEQGGG